MRALLLLVVWLMCGYITCMWRISDLPNKPLHGDEAAVFIVGGPIVLGVAVLGHGIVSCSQTCIANCGGK